MNYKTAADLKKLFKKEVVSKLPGGYIPEAIQLKYVQWLQNKLLEKPLPPISEVTEVELTQLIADMLIGNLPIHKGPFVSNAEARRVAHYDNTKRFEVANEIAVAIINKLKA